MFTVRYYLCDILFTEQDPETDSQSGKRDEVRMEKDKKQEKWVQPRHRVIRKILGGTLGVYTRLRYHARIEPFREEGDRQYLVLMNHQTPFDQFFVGMAFHGPVYYLASEDIFSNGWVSSLIKYLVAPIPIKKQTTDVRAILNCIKVSREGGTIAIAPEGNRTYSGRTEYMNPAVAGLAKKMKLPIALFRIEGGYGVEPRWTDGRRKGPIKGYVSRVMEPEEYLQLSNEALASAIYEELYVDEAKADSLYKSNKRAEYLERAVYVCPVCGLSKFESHCNDITCCTCGRTVTYGEDKTLTGVGFDFPFRFVAQWYDHQEDYVNQMDLTQYTQKPLFLDEAMVSEVIVYEKKVPLRENADIALYGDRVVFDEGTESEFVIPFADAQAVTVLGRNKLNIYYDKRVFQLKGGKRFNALKYVHFCYRCKNILRGEESDQFLGI